VNKWFNNKPWGELTAADIRRVYDGLESGSICNARGKRFIDTRTYYNKILKGKPFQLAGKLELAREVLEYFADRQNREVRYVEEAEFRKIVGVLSNPLHLFLVWLAFDVGENIDTLLRLQKLDFTRRLDTASGEIEYVVNLPKEKLKRSRTPRSEPTLHAETARYADIVLTKLRDQDLIFPFGYRHALKILQQAARRAGAVCSPKGGAVRWKDFRSGMACYLLKSGCSIEEVNARLGHRPSSRQIDVYVTFLALDRRRPKKVVDQSNLRQVHAELEELRHREVLSRQSMGRQSEENQTLRASLERTRRELHDLRELVQTAIGKNN
jgi:hypothetical protein